VQCNMHSATDATGEGPARQQVMQVGIDCRYLRSRPSGIGTYVQALVDRLPGAAPSDAFVLWAHASARRPLSRAPNVREVTVGVEPNSLWTILFADRYASFGSLDVFHGAHNLLPYGLPCPGVLTLHDLLPLDRPDLDDRGYVKSLYYPRAVRHSVRHAARVIVTTAATAERLRAVEPAVAARTRVVPLAADPAFRVAPDPDAARARAAALVGVDPFVLVVGRHGLVKRHELAVHAFAVHVPRPARLVVVERQSSGQRLAALARRLGVADRVVWIPHVELPDLVGLFQAAAVLLQPSIYEGFGLPVVEAMACGCPVVASDLPTLREVVGDAGLLVPAGDVDGYGRALATLIRSPARRAEAAARGLRRAADLSWDRCARDTLAVYREAAERQFG